MPAKKSQAKSGSSKSPRKSQSPKSGKSPKGGKRKQSPKSKLSKESSNVSDKGLPIEDVRPCSANAQAPQKIVNITLFSAAFTPPVEVHRVRVRGRRTQALTIAGVGNLQYILPGGDEASGSKPQSRGSDGGSSDGEERGVNDSVEAPIASVSLGSADAEQMLAKSLRWTERLQRAAASWMSLFEPVTQAFSEAVLFVPEGRKRNLPTDSEQRPDGVTRRNSLTRLNSFATYGPPPPHPRDAGLSGIYAGHPVARALKELTQVRSEAQRCSAGFSLVARAADLASKEYFSQCEASNGMVALKLAQAIVRRVAAERCGSDSLSPIPAKTKKGGRRASAVHSINRAAWLEWLEPAMDTVLLQASATRADSPDFYIQVRARRASTAEASQGSSCRDSSPGRAERTGTSSTRGAQRMQFWDGFFAYRELGSVRRADPDWCGSDQKNRGGATSSTWPDLASAASTRTRSDSPPLRAASRTTGRQREHSPSGPNTARARDTSTSPFNLHGWTSSGDEAEEQDATRGQMRMFPALGDRRESTANRLRRPPGATAEPLPFSARRGRRPSQVEGSTVSSGKGDLPQLGGTASVSSACGAGMPPAGEPSVDGLSLPAPPASDRNDLRLPMFVGVAAEPFREWREPPDQPFVSHGVGFNLRFLMEAMNKSQSSAEPASGLAKRRSTAKGVTPTRPEQQCSYCRHHSNEVCPSAPAKKWLKKADARYAQERNRYCMNNIVEVAGVSKPVCQSCGGFLDEPFKPRVPSILQTSTDGDQEMSLNATGVSMHLSDSREATVTLNEDPDEFCGFGDDNNIGRDDTWPPWSAAGADCTGLGDSMCDRPSTAASTAVAFGSPKRPITKAEATYLAACERLRARPVSHAAAAFAGGPSGAVKALVASDMSLSMRNGQLDDQGLAALLESVAKRNVDRPSDGLSIDFAGNRLTDRGVLDLLGRLDALDWTRRLESLDFAGNRLVTFHALEPLCSMLQGEMLSRLCCLRLGGIELGDAFAQKLFQGMSFCASIIREIDLSYVGLGRMGLVGPVAAAGLLRLCDSLRVLDVSGNYLRAGALAEIGQALHDGGSVQSLHLAHNTGNWVGAGTVAGSGSNRENGSSAMCALCEELQRIPTLRMLDLRDAQVDPCCAFILAHALAKHPCMETLLLNSNPLGEYGIRVILSKAFLATSAKASANRLSVLSIDPCTFGSRCTPPLSVADPSGSYVIDLSEPCSRIVVTYCLECWHAVAKNWPFNKAFPSISLDGKPLSAIDKDAEGHWQIPQTGILSFTFLFYASESSTQIPQSRPQDRHRCPLAENLEGKALRFAAACFDQTTLMAVIRALAADFFVREAVAITLCRWLGDSDRSSTGLQAVAAEMLLDGATGFEDRLALPELLTLWGAERAAATQAAQSAHGKCTLEFMVPENPTGRYVFQLGAPAERRAAEHLLLVNAWEVELAKAASIPDVSQAGNYHCLRNEAFNAARFVYHSDWVLPIEGVLEFDLAVPRRPAKTARPLKEEAWQKILSALSSSDVPPICRVLCFRQASPGISCVTTQQVCAAIKELRRSAWPRLDPSVGAADLVERSLLGALLFKIKDFKNTREALFEGEGPFQSPETLRKCEAAFGRLNLADPVRIHGRPMLLRLDVHEDRQICCILLAVMFREGGQTIDPACLQDCAHGLGVGDGWGGLAAGEALVPKGQLRPLRGRSAQRLLEGWALRGPPARGSLAVTYAMEGNSGTKQDTALRARLARQFCGWA